MNELLFRHGMNPSAPDWLGITPLHHLARKGDVEKTALFLDHGAEIHSRDEDLCSTPLGWAAKFGHKSMVEFLLARGAKPNLPDDPPWATPLAWATRRKHPEVVEVLRSHGAQWHSTRRPAAIADPGARRKSELLERVEDAEARWRPRSTTASRASSPGRGGAPCSPRSTRACARPWRGAD